MQKRQASTQFASAAHTDGPANTAKWFLTTSPVETSESNRICSSTGPSDSTETALPKQLDIPKSVEDDFVHNDRHSCLHHQMVVVALHNFVTDDSALGYYLVATASHCPMRLA